MTAVNTLRCPDCGLTLSPAEAYGPDRDTCPHASCRGELELTDKGAEQLVDGLLEGVSDT